MSMRFSKQIRILFVITLLSLCLPFAGCVGGDSLDETLNAATDGYRFNIAKWEIDTIGGKLQNALFDRESQKEDGKGLVSGYNSLEERINSLKADMAANSGGSEEDHSELERLEEQRLELAEELEKTITTQINETLSELDIVNPFDEKYVRLDIIFPPVNFELQETPHLLVVSPRDKIDSIREITLLPDLSVEEMENIEDQVDGQGVSSLVVGLGGLATYPSYITDNAGLGFIIETAVHEWLHQYLAFKPLGFMYILDLTGINRNYDIATMNEALVGMVSKEIAGMIYEKYYDGEIQEGQPSAGGFFNREMREIRLAVDAYLACGKIEEAERYMEESRDFLAAHGYYIRKLNQAYFAFYGTYAASPTSVSPIGAELRELRSSSDSLKDFLETAAAMTSRQDLAESVQ